ncbi:MULTISPECIES: monofunctional biosynthetic peptidoglycan transglycosylase [Bartonella]|uniref:Biosynthetic peptidoglycan transglycosylase n=1 Tax=Bartonella choladocola TaxID=2750995 RepID=A0A1U9MKV6_9HYPH|nr:monofunctional biosynthetic peptidoglycan transglycosylase [Bartonella choladocola]AQT48368.1 monofunctional biosynthetic peptidoglycan transglycosylase [Bartonella choladocola]
MSESQSPQVRFHRKRSGKLRVALYLLVFLLALPFFMLLLYKLPFIHPVSTLMLRDKITFTPYEREWTSIEDISPHLVYAVMMSEDGQFCFHNGVDWDELKTVISRNGGPNRGASTITMQMVKNLFLWHDRSYLRKGLEIPYATVADAVLSKRRIMEIYLNIAEWGPGIYGAEAASRHFFKRSAKSLNPRQAAYLAVTLPNPKLRNPARPSVNLTRLERLIERRLRQSGAYTQCLRE